MKNIRVLLFMISYIFLSLCVPITTCAEISANDGTRDIVYCDTIEEAGTILRNTMVEHKDNVTIGYLTNDNSKELSIIWEDIWVESFKHTGIDKEGDYLKFLVSERKGTAGLELGKDSYAYTIVLGYDISYYTTKEQEAAVDAYIEDIINELKLVDKTDYQKIETIYDYVCNNIYYDYINLNDKEYKLKYTAYAALNNHTAVCQGYVEVLYRLLLKAGIDNRIIPGVKINKDGTRENHVWNIIKYNDVYYNTDVTWDSELFGYDYYMKNDKTFNPTHIREDEYCLNSFCNQYPISNTSLDFDNISDKVIIDNELFPDDNFRQFILDSIDKDGDCYLSRAECIAVKNIKITNMTMTDLQGIEVFDKLYSLYVENSGLINADLTNNLNLFTISLHNNQEFHNLDISNNLKLFEIIVDNCPIGKLDVKNNRRLKRIDADSCGLDEIDISNNYNIEYLDIYDNNISSVDVSHLKNLYIFNCQNNPITNIDVSANSNLVQLICQKCPINQLDVSNNHLLESLWCSDIGADYIDVSHNPLLEQLFCGDNNIAGLDLSQNEKLTDLRASGNIINIGDVSEYDMTLLQGFVPEKASKWQGAEFDPETNKIFNISSPNVCYHYDCGNGHNIIVTLQCIGDTVDISEENFPDIVFREYIRNSFDHNNDGFLQISEIDDVIDISIEGLDVYDITGIQWFSRLIRLNCSESGIEEIRLLSTHQLSTLKCYNCSELKKVDLGDQPGLGYMDFRKCGKIKMLDMSDCGYAPYTGSDFICYLDSCKQLHTVVFPNKKIHGLVDKYYFYTLDTLENIVFTGDAPDFGTNSFWGMREINVYYPADNSTWTDEIKNNYAAYKIEWIESGKEPVIESEEKLMRQYNGIAVSEENFPDKMFREYVINNIDKNNDGELSYYEIDDVRELDLSKQKINDLTGIDYFLHLQKLNCMNNDIKEIHCTSTHMLNEVRFSNNVNFKVFDVGRQPELSGYDFQGCAIEDIDLSESGYCTRDGWSILCYFGYCSKLQTIILPKDIKNFSSGSFSFNGCIALKCLVFTGNAPKFKADSFKGLKDIIVCYPSDNDTWTNDIKINYSADNIDWIEGGLEEGLELLRQKEEEAERFANEIVVDVDNNSFPDEIFRDYVLTNFDSDKDGSLTNGEISAVSTINLENVGVEDLTGIDYFINLKKLVCYCTNIITIKMTSVHTLEMLSCTGNEQLVDIDVGIQPMMRWYDVSSCHKLTKLDFSNCGHESDVSAYWSISSCEKLSTIIFSGGVKKIDSNSPHFKYLNVDTFVFVGDAPKFGDDAFSQFDDIVVYYPPENATWKKEIMKNYGAHSIKWIAGSKDKMYQDKVKEEQERIEREKEEQERIEREKREKDARAVQRFVDSINNLGDISELTIEDSEAVVISCQLYDELTDDQKALVEQRYVELLDCAKTRIEELERQKAEEEAEKAAEEARRQAEEQARKEKEEADRKAAKEVTDIIIVLPSVEDINIEDENDIVLAREKYEELTEDQKAIVEDETVEILKCAENRIYELKQAKAEEEAEKAAEEARRQAEEQARKEKEEAEERARKEKEEADRKAAKEVTDVITMLPSVENINIEDENDIVKAREKYEELAEDQKAIVEDETVEILKCAENRIYELKQAKAEEEAEKAAEEARRQAEEKARREQEEAEEQARKEQEEAEEKARKEKEEAEERAAEEARRQAEEKTRKEKEEAEEKARKDGTVEQTTEEVKTPDDKSAAGDKPIEEKAEKLTEEGNPTKGKTEKPAEENNINYLLYKSNYYRIVGKKKVSFVKPQKNSVKKISIPNVIKYNKKKYKVVSIDNNACYNCSKLKTVKIGDNVSEVGTKAFASCKKLKSITFGKGIIKLNDQVLEKDRTLRKIVFKSSKITTFGKKTFVGVPRKVDILIPRKKVKKYVKLIKQAK